MAAAYPKSWTRPGRGAAEDIRWAGWLGALGLAVWTVAWVSGALLQRHYRVTNDYVSGLAAPTAQHPEVMVAGFALTGLILVAAAIAIGNALGEDHWARRGAIALAVVGVGLIAAGLLRTDCSTATVACPMRDQYGITSWHSQIHNLLAAGLLVFAGVPLAFVPFLRKRGMRWLCAYSLLSAAVALLAIVMLHAHAWPMWAGITQRVAIYAPECWLACFGFALPSVPVVSRGSCRQEEPMTAEGRGERG